MSPGRATRSLAMTQWPCTSHLTAPLSPTGLATTSSLAHSEGVRMAPRVPHQQRSWSPNTACDIPPNKALPQMYSGSMFLWAALLAPMSPHCIPAPLSPPVPSTISDTPWHDSASNDTRVTTSSVPLQLLLMALSGFETAPVWEVGWEGCLGNKGGREDRAVLPTKCRGCVRGTEHGGRALIPTACKESCQGQLCQEHAEIAHSSCSSATCHWCWLNYTPDPFE